MTWQNDKTHIERAVDVTKMKARIRELEAENAELRKMPSQGEWGRKLALMTDAKLRTEAERDAAIEAARHFYRESLLGPYPEDDIREIVDVEIAARLKEAKT